MPHEFLSRRSARSSASQGVVVDLFAAREESSVPDRAPLATVPVPSGVMMLSDDQPMTQIDRLGWGVGLVTVKAPFLMGGFVEFADGRQCALFAGDRGVVRMSDDWKCVTINPRHVNDVRRVFLTGAAICSTVVVESSAMPWNVRVPVNFDGYGVACELYTVDGIGIVRRGSGGFANLRDLAVAHGFTGIAWQSATEPMKESM